MFHMPNLEIWEWGLKIFCGAPTLTTMWTICYSHNTNKHRAANLTHTLFNGEKMAEFSRVAAGIQCHVEYNYVLRPLLVVTIASTVTLAEHARRGLIIMFG